MRAIGLAEFSSRAALPSSRSSPERGSYCRRSDLSYTRRGICGRSRLGEGISRPPTHSWRPVSLVRSSASGLAIGVAYPRRHSPERIRSASSRSRTRSTGIIHEGRGLARSVRRISRSGGVSSGGSRQLLRCWATAQDGRAPRRSSSGTARPEWDDYETVIVLASEEAHRALLGTTNPTTLFAQLSFGPNRGFPGTTVLIAASSG